MRDRTVLVAGLACGMTAPLLAQADLRVTKSGPATVDASATVAYTVTVTNAGPNAAASVLVTDSLPAAGSFVSATPGGTRVGRRLQWPTVASLPSGASLTYTVVWRAPTTAVTLVNFAFAGSPTADPVPADNDAANPAARVTTAVRPVADVATTKTGPATVNAGATFTYTLTIRNNGPSSAAGLVVSDTLPPGATFLSASNAGTHAAGVVSWPVIATLNAGASTTRSVTVRAPAGAASLQNVAASTAATYDPTPGNNNGSAPAARVTTTVNPVADVVVTKSGATTVNALANLTYTVTVRNAGPSPALNVALVDTLPAAAAFVSATGAPGRIGNVLTWPAIPSLASGASQSFSVVVTAPASGTLLNLAAATSSSTDLVPANNNGTAAASRVTTTVTPRADVVLTKAGPATAPGGGSVGYTLTVRNAGPSTAANVIVRDSLPAGFAFVAASGGGTVASRTVTWPTIDSLANGAVRTFTLTATAAPTAGTYVNIGRSASSTADPVTANNNGSAAASRVSTAVTASADVVASKTGPAGVVPGQPVSYTVTIANAGPSAATGVVLRDTLPASATFVSASGGATRVGNVLTWPTIASLANGASQSYTVVVTAPASGVLTNVVASTSTSSDPTPANNNGSAPAARVTTAVTPVADVVVTGGGPASVPAAGTFSYTLAATNGGPSAAVGVVLSDTLPAGVTFVSATGGGSVSGNVVTWPAIASLAAGAGVSQSVTVIAPPAGTLLNVVAGASSTADPEPGNNDGSAPAARTTTVVVEQADVGVATSAPPTVNAGANVAWSVVVRNTGPSTAASVLVTDTLPPGATFVSATGGGTLSGNVVTWPVIAALASGASQSWSVTVSAPATGTLTNAVGATASTADPNPADNVARATTVVVEVAAVATTKSGPATVNAAQSFTYAIRVANAGPSAAASVLVADTLPAGVSFVSATGGGTLSGRVVTWPLIAALPSGASATFDVNVRAPASGTLVNVVASGAATLDPDPSDNDGSAAAARVTTTVIEQADLVVGKSGPGTVNAGQPVVYTVSVSNAGPSDAANVVVVDTLPAGVTFVGATGGGAVSGSVVTWPLIPLLGSGASRTLSVTVLAPATGVLTNRAAAGSSTPDPDPLNNDGSAPASRVVTSVIEVADVATGKTGPATVNAAATFSYAVTVRNAGPSSAANVVVTDTLPAGTIFVNATDGGLVNGRVVTWPAISSLGNGEARSFGVTVTAPASGTLLNIAASTSSTADPVAADNDGASASARVTTSVSERADVAATASGPARVNAGGDVDYVVVLRNLGPSLARGVTAAASVPAGAPFVSATDGGAVNGASVRWPAVDLALGETRTFGWRVRAPLLGTMSSAVSSAAATADPVAENNDGTAAAAQVHTTIEPVDLAVAKSAPDQFQLGTLGRYTITVTNVGLAPSVGAIAVTDTLAPGLRFVAASGPGWTCSASGQVVTCVLPTPLAPAVSSQILLDAEILPGIGAEVRNAVAMATPGDTVLGGNNAALVTTRVLAESPLLADKRASRADAEPGDFVDYTVSLRNRAAAPVPGVMVHDQLPLGFRFQSGSARVNGRAIADPTGAPGPALAFELGDLAGSAEASISYRLAVGPGAVTGDGTNRAVAVSATGVQSNTAAATVRIVGGVFTERGMIVGKIFVDAAFDPDRTQGPREIGIPGVRILLEDGTSTVTDEEGKFNFFGLAPRLHVLKVDRLSLPPGARLAAASSRNAGDGWTRFVDLRNGELARADFVEASHDRAVLAAVIARRNVGEVVAAMTEAAPRSLDDSTTGAPTFAPLLDGLSAPVMEEGAAVPLLRLPEARQPERRPAGSGQLELTLPAGAVPADGTSRVPIRLRLVDAQGAVLKVGRTVTLEAALGRWQVEDRDATEPGVQADLQDGELAVELVASSEEGIAEIRVTSDDLVQTGRLAFLPVARPTVALGLVQGRFDLRALAKGALVPVTPRDGFEEELTDLSVASDSGLRRASARAALFLKGKVKGSYLLTLAFDSERDPGKRFLRDIQPEEYYPVYGDASVKEFAAQSFNRLYVRVDKGRNHFLYGDFITSAATPARELGGYLRSLTGAVQHLESSRLQANVFGSRTRVTQVVDELPGRGISGPFDLSTPNARLNSERVEILTRDRNQPSRILRIVPLQRFTDYTVEPFTGRLLLRQPVPSVDAQLNPLSLRIAYEVEAADAEQAWVYGGDVQLRVGTFAEVGGALVRDENPLNTRGLYSLNASARLGRGTQLVGEWAASETDSLGGGHAARVEVRHHAGRVDANLFGAVSGTQFSNPSSSMVAGRLELGVRAAFTIDERTRLLAEALHSEDRRTDGRRRGALVGLERRLSRTFRAELGYRWAEETVAPASGATAGTPGATPNQTSAVRGRLTAELASRKGNAFAEFEQDVSEASQRRAALGAEYWLLPRLRAYGRYEILSSFAGPYALNGAQRLGTTTLGLDLGYLKDGRLFSEYRGRDAFAGREAEASIGLRNRWQLARGLRLDGSFERVAPMRGAGVTEATAVTAAVEYTANALWRATARGEYREAEAGDNVLLTAGYARKLSRDWTVLGRGLWNALPDDQRRVRGQAGLAWRETDRNRWSGLARLEYRVDRLLTAPGGRLASRRVGVASAHLNWQPARPLNLTAQYAGKWLREDDGLASRTASQLGQLRAIYDLDRNWDVGLQGSANWIGAFDSWRFGTGGEVGRRVMDNLRLAVGYNVFGFRDAELRETDYTLRGAYLRFDFKFDETLWQGADREVIP